MNHIKEIAIKAVETVTGITFDEMNSLGPNGNISRKREHAEARRFVIFLIKNNTQLSLKAIGKTFRDQDHSTVIHALQQHENFLSVEKKYSETFEKVETEFNFILKAFESGKAQLSDEYRNFVQSNIDKCNAEVERWLSVLRFQINEVPPSIQDLGFSVVNLNE